MFSFSNLELKPCGIVEVRLVQAKELSNKELIGKSDPFASIFVRPLSNRTKRSKTIVSSWPPVCLFSFFSFLFCPYPYELAMNNVVIPRIMN